MSNYEDDQSEDGELARSPVPQEEMDFSLSDEDLDTGDSLDIKPPQAKIRTPRPSKDDRKVRHAAKSDKYKDHSRRDKKHIYRERDKPDNRIKRDVEISKNSDRDLFNAKDNHRGREYVREKEGHRERDHFRERDAYRESEPYRERDPHRIKESHREKEIYKDRDQYKEAYREREAVPPRERDRESRYAEAERPKASYDRKPSTREDGQPRSRHLALAQELPISARSRDPSVRYGEKENHDKLSGDKELEDLRSRLLSKRRSNEQMRKDPLPPPPRSSRLPQLDRTQQQRRDKLLETEREMSRRKEASQAALAARRSRRDERGEGDDEEDRTEGEDGEGSIRGKRTSSGQISPVPPPRKRLCPPAPIAHRPIEDIVTVSDASDQEVHSDHSNPEEGEHTGSSSESSDSSEEDSESAEDEEEEEEEEEEEDEEKMELTDRSRDRERERGERERERDRDRDRERDRGRDRRRDEAEDQARVKEEDEREQTNSPIRQTVQPSHSPSPSSSHSVSPTGRSRTPSRSRSRSRSHSFSPISGANGSGRDDREREERERKESVDTPLITSPLPDLPPYFPALQGCRSVEEFQCLNRIEEGTYGVVYRARDKTTDEIVALKRLKMEKEKEGFPITSLREINTLLKGQHPNMVTVREIVVGSNMDKIFIVMDYVEHDLKGLMETMRAKKQVFLPGEVKCLMQQLLQAVHHLHDNWILHRDLKTSNLLLSHKGILKVGDFGLAREYGSPLKSYTPVVVTLWYRAPELLLGAKTYSTPIDVWSVGCIFAEFITMQALFPGKSEVDQLNKIFKDLGTPNETVWPGWSELSGSRAAWAEQAGGGLRARVGPTLANSALNLLTSLLTYDPSKRISAHTALGHTFFKEQPLAIDPAMFPTWPAKSEGGRRHQHSPKPPSGGDQYKLLGDDLSDHVGHGFHMGTAASARPSFHTSVPGFSLKF